MLCHVQRNVTHELTYTQRWSRSNDCPDETPSGGHKDLNTTTAITPLAFYRGKGHASVYDMTEEEFTELARSHLHTSQRIETEFSSWSASLSFVLNLCPGVGTGGLKLAARDHEKLHICIIDTKMLETNQAFYVPLLNFMSPGDFNYSHEYLVHGPIEGPYYKAIPYSVLESSPGFSFSSNWWFDNDSVPIEPLTKEDVEIARTAGRLFGPYFTLPMMLAIVSCKRRDEDLWRHGVDAETVGKVLTVLPNVFKIPESWKKDKTITGRQVISTKNYSDTKQMTRLMRAMVDRSKRKRNVHEPDEESGDEESEYGEAPEDEPEEAERAEDESAETEAEGVADDAEPTMVEAEVERRAGGSTKEVQVEVTIAEKESEVAKDHGGRSSKGRQSKGKTKKLPKIADEDKESDATSAAKAIWRRTYGKRKHETAKSVTLT